MRRFPLAAFFYVAAVAACTLPFSMHAASRTGSQPDGGGIDLAVTLGTDTSPDACGTTTTLDVDLGQQVNFCYVVTNTSSTTLNYQQLSDDVTGSIIPLLSYALAPGASYQYNRIVSASASEAPTSTWASYDDLPHYTYDDTVTADFIDITTIGTPLNLFTDEAVGVTMDFPFSYYGATSDQLTISNNGGILFGTEDSFLVSFNSTLPNATIGSAILPYWTNIAADMGNVYYATVGASPNRQFVVEWYDRNHDGTQGGPDSPSGATFEVVLYENGGQILFNYQTTSFGDPNFDDGASATVGLNGDGTHATQYSYDTTALHDGLAILFTPTYGTVYSASAAVSLNVGAPIASVSPGSIAATVAPGASTTQPVTIGNSGNFDLAWQFGQAPSRAHFPPLSRFVLPLGDPRYKASGRGTSAANRAPNRHIALPYGTSVPAFGFDESNAVYIGMDANAPETTTTLGPSIPVDTFAGDFVANDFTVEYAIDTSTDILYSVSTIDGSAAPIATVTPPVDNYAWTALRWDATTATAYAVLIGPIRRNALSPWYSNLYTIDLASGAATLVGPITNIADPSADILMIDIAISPDGLVYGLDLVSDALMAIDKTDGSASVIGSIGFDANSDQSMDFDDASGTLYLAGCVNDPVLHHCVQSNMYTVDTSTGLATLIATIGQSGQGDEIGGLAIADVSGCSTPQTLAWLSFAPSGGTTAAGTTTSTVATFDATALGDGTYSGTACLFSNDPANRRMEVPVSLIVSGVSDRIFANGFDP